MNSDDRNNIDIADVLNDRRVEDINRSIFDRNKPSHTLQYVFDPRGQHTKYQKMPVYKRTSTIKPCPVVIQPTYVQEKQFNPGTSAPFSGYASQVDTESRIQNMFMSNQKYANQTQYIPGSNSDLYNNSVPNYSSGRQYWSHHALLFNEPTFKPVNPDKYNINIRNSYNLHTRQQRQDIRRV